MVLRGPPERAKAGPGPGIVSGPPDCDAHTVRSAAGGHCAVRNTETQAQAARFADAFPVGQEECVRGTRPQRISPVGKGMV